MKAIILSGVAALALAFTTTPAAAQVAGIGGIAGNINVGNIHVTNNNDLTVSVDNTLTASSGSGFSGTIKINGATGQQWNAAVFGGSGDAYAIAGGLSAHDMGLTGAASGSEGLYGGATYGNAKIDASVMNFGQAEYTKSFTLDYTAKQDFTLNDWNAQGFVVAGFAGFN